MIRLSFKLPKQIAVAVSGGCDSMAALDFLRRNRDVTVLHYNHATDFSDSAEDLVTEYCRFHNLVLIKDKLTDTPDLGQSLEDFWRYHRYSFFNESHGALPVVTCHHLDDVIETWLFTSMHGNSRLIPSKRDQFIRPFLETRKAVLEDWCERKCVPYIEDPSNNDIRFMRNYIRHELVPKALRVNPGIYKVLRKKLKKNESMVWSQDWPEKNSEMT